MGEIYRITFESTDRNDNVKKGSFILKIAPRNVKYRELLEVRNLFMGEIFMYEQVSTKI